jgi:hypothetical protein
MVTEACFNTDPLMSSKAKDMRSTRKNFGAAAIGAFAVLGLSTISPSAATAQAASCGGDVIVSASGLGKLEPPEINSLPAVTVNIPAGTYVATGSSTDSLHPGAATQANEQWFVTFLGADGGSVGQTTASPDLADAVITSSFSLGSVTLSGPAKSAVFTHAFPNNGFNSIFPVCVGLSKVAYPPAPIPAPVPAPAPAPTAAPTTVAASAPAVIDFSSVIVPPTVPPSTVPATVAPTTAAPAKVAPATVASPTIVVVPADVVQVAGVQVTKDETVAFTGSNTLPMLAASVGLLGVGAVLTTATRRRRTR